MSHKTKAALQGRQCNTENKEQNQHTRPIAGGQSLSDPVITGTAPLARLGGMSKSGRSPNRYYENFVVLSANFSAHLQAPNGWLAPRVNNFYSVVRVTKSHAHPQATQKLGCLGCTAIHQPPEKSRSFGRYPDIGYHSLSASLAFLRWRRLISPMAAVIRKPAVLSPLFFTDSISSNTSCGTRTFTCFDLLFTEPVAITDSPRVWCYSLYAKKNHIQYLTCYAPSNKVNSTLIKPRHKNGNASECGNTTEASNQTVI